MQKNMGSFDKIVRIVLAVIAVALAATGTLAGTAAIVAYGAAAIIVLTSLVSFCPLYRVLGLRSCANC